MVWSCAVVHHRHPRFLAAVAAAAGPRIHTFQSQTLANTLWGYSVLGVYPPALFNAAADEIVRRFQGMSAARAVAEAEEEARAGAAAGRAGRGAGGTGAAGEETAGGGGREEGEEEGAGGGGGGEEGERGGGGVRFAGGPPPREALAAAEDDGGFSSGDEGGPPAQPAQHDPQRQYPPQYPPQPPFNDFPVEFRGQEISNILIAYARGCVIHQGLLQVLEEELCSETWGVRRGRRVRVSRLQEEFSSQALANTLWAFASLRWYPARLLPVITAALARLLGGMSSQELANSLWAFARLAYHPGRVLSSYLSVIERRVEEFEGQGCTNSLWALAVLKATHSAAFVALLRRFVALEATAQIPGELQYNQVLQAVLLAQFEARGGRVGWRPEIDLPEAVVDKALAAWGGQQAVAQLSGFHLDVSEGLKRLGVDHSIEFLVARDLLSIDIAVTTDGALAPRVFVLLLVWRVCVSGARARARRVAGGREAWGAGRGGLPGSSPCTACDRAVRRSLGPPQAGASPSRWTDPSTSPSTRAPRWATP
jgi:hypothetical protein